MALLLGTRHDHELMATRQQGPQLNRLLIWHRTWFGTDGFGEVGDVGGVDRVALGEAAEGAGEFAGLAWIDHGDRQVCLGQSGRHDGFIATGGFQHDQLRCEWPQPVEQVRQALCVGLAVEGDRIRPVREP